MNNYYEILELSKDASKMDIKKAYFRLVRKYPPEKNEEMFKELREAYDTLIDDSKRSNYDNISNLPKNIQTEFEEALEAMNNGAEDWAISVFKDIEKHYGNSNKITELLGDAFLSNGNTGNAIKEYAKLVEENPNEYNYLLKLGKAFSERGFSNKAEKTLKTCIKLDENNPHAWTILINMYLSFDKFTNKVLKTIDNAVNICNRQDYNYYNFFFQYFVYDLETDNYSLVPSHIEKIEKIIESSEVITEYVVDKLIDSSIYFLFPDLVNYAIKLIDLVIKYNSKDNEAYEEIISLIKLTANRIISMKIFLKDTNSDDIISSYIKYNIYKDICLLSNHQDNYIETFYKELSITNKIYDNPSKYKKAIKYLKNKYTILYKFKKDFFESILNNTFKNTEEYKMYKHASKLIEAISPLMIDDYEYDDYYDDYYDDDDDDEYEYEIEQQKPIYVEKIGRNDPCPCGSGKKYKKCCLNKD